MIKLPPLFIAGYLVDFGFFSIGLFAGWWPAFVIGAALLVFNIGALTRLARVRDQILYLGLDLADFDLAPHSPWRTRARRRRR